ncbi:MAG: DUF3455 domain-containing protein [Polaromonas sp.]|nr:DUF3455 domain-containing protein [Polaromonas sp.]
MKTNASFLRLAPAFDRPGAHQRRGLTLAASLLLMTAAMLIAGCGASPLARFDAAQQQGLPADVRVPAGHQAVLEARASGELQYECQAIKRAPFEYAWLPRDRSIELRDGSNSAIVLSRSGRSWVHRDGSQLAVREFVEVDNGPHSLPFQRARVEPSTLSGALHNISYIQRINTVGGLPSVRNCSSAELGMRVQVPYEAEYVFWRARSS